MANNIVMKITDYIAHLWHDTDNDIVMAENINGWEDTLQQHAEFLKRFSWQPNTTYLKNSVLLYPFGLHTKLVSKNAGTSGSVEPTWSEATGVEGSRTIQDNDIVCIMKKWSSSYKGDSEYPGNAIPLYSGTELYIKKEYIEMLEKQFGTLMMKTCVESYTQNY